LRIPNNNFVVLETYQTGKKYRRLKSSTCLTLICFASARAAAVDSLLSLLPSIDDAPPKPLVTSYPPAEVAGVAGVLKEGDIEPEGTERPDIVCVNPPARAIDVCCPREPCEALGCCIYTPGVA
jgi:hypothetical protein